MNWLAIILTVLFAIAGAALYHDLKKSFTDEHKKRLEKILLFGFLYISLNVTYFFLLAWLWNSIDISGIKLPGKKYQLIGIILVMVLPLLVQAKIIPILRREGFTYKGIRLSIDVALLLSIISLFLKDSLGNEEFNNANAYYFSGIAVYFTFSKVLIEWLILTEDLDDKPTSPPKVEEN